MKTSKKYIMKNKEEIIKEAWGEHWENIKDVVSKDGYIPYWHYSHYDIKDCNLKITDGCSSYRKKSLQGIENNNNWIKIESEDWLKKFKIDGSRTKYYVDNIDEDYFTIVVLVKLEDEISYLTLSDYIFIKKELNKDCIIATHYQPIQKPIPPIY